MATIANSTAATPPFLDLYLNLGFFMDGLIAGMVASSRRSDSDGD
jgi:hypothetical protein